MAYPITIYCGDCNDDRDFSREQRRHTLSIRGEDITVEVPVLVCPVCHATQPDPAADVPALAFAEYRQRHGLLTPERIAAIREQYDLGREAFAAVLGMSAATLYRYEGGALQDEPHDMMIFACDDPDTMRRLVARRRERLSPLQIKRFEEALKKRAVVVGAR